MSLINPPADSANPPLNNQILEAAEQKVESQLTPANRGNYLKIVVAGMKAALLKGPDGILGSLRQSKDPVSDCAKGAVNLCFILSRQSQGRMPPQALVPAGMTLMLKALDFADKIGIVKVDNAAVVRATHIFTDQIFKALKITPQMLQTAASKVHQITQDPVKMAQIQRHVGVVKDPNAATEPTPMPEATDGV